MVVVATAQRMMWFALEVAAAVVAAVLLWLPVERSPPIVMARPTVSRRRWAGGEAEAALDVPGRRTW